MEIFLFKIINIAILLLQKILMTNIVNVLRQVSINGVIAIGMTFVILTGGIAYGKYATEEITKRVKFIAPVTVYGGEDELLALAQGALRVLNGEEEAKVY